MVVPNGGWVQNARFLNINATQNNKMTAKGILICCENSHLFQERTLMLDQPVKIGRSVARAKATATNAIFDCRVLSRNHALLWYADGKFFLQDTGSSNGTFVNNQRLSTPGYESKTKEVSSGDIVQFGVDVVESTKKVTHGCIIAKLKLFLPDGKEAKASPNTAISLPASNVSLEDLYKLNQVMQEASRREKALYSKLGYLQQLVDNTRKAASQSWKALIEEDRLLSWAETMESQLVVYSKIYTEDKFRKELVKLHEEKANYQNAAKEALQKVLQEKLEVTQRLVQLEGRLSETEEECQSLHNVSQYTQMEIQELSNKYTETQKRLQETTNKLMESEAKLKDLVESAEQEKQELLKRLEDQAKIEKSLQARLRDSRLDSVNIYKQITALRNYMQTLQDMNSKLLASEMLESKDEENPIEAIDVILNKLNSIHMDNTDVDLETNFYSGKEEQDNQLNSQDVDSNQLNDSDLMFSKDPLEDSMDNNESLTDYILPPPSRRTLVNGNANIDNSILNVESDTNSDATDETCSITSDDTSEKSVIEIKKEDSVADAHEETFVSHKMEVRFACEENGEQLEIHYAPTEQRIKDADDTESSYAVDADESSSRVTEKYDKEDEEVKDVNERADECEEEHSEGDYVKTLKPLSKSDSAQQGLLSRDYLLQTLMGSLGSLKGEDDLESQQVVKRELEDLKDWLIRESHDAVLDRLKELYYRAKNEMQRIQEVNEELVILKERYNALLLEKADVSRKYATLRSQCGDILNVTYAKPIHYVTPIAIVLIAMLLEHIF